MTSPAAYPTSAATSNGASTASHASALGASNQSAQTDSGVVGSFASSAQNEKSHSLNSVNDNTSPTNPPTHRRGNSSVNGAASNHSRKTSVIMAANGPNSFNANGGAVGGSKSNIQFGFDSPAQAHSTPQAADSAPIAIPPGGNARVPSPAHSPSPIPQPSASGGKPPSGLQSGQMTFGSLGSDGERHLRQGSVPPNPNALGGGQPGSHFRRDSSQSDTQGPGRGNYNPQNGRGRGNFNPHNNFNANQMGFPPNGQFRHGPGQGRGMAPNFQNQPRNMPYPNSPQPNHRSPALVPSMPGTPNMPPANMQPNMSMQTPPQHHYPPPMGGGFQQVQPPLRSLSSTRSYGRKNTSTWGKARRHQRDGSSSFETSAVDGPSTDGYVNKLDDTSLPTRYDKHADKGHRNKGIVNHGDSSATGAILTTSFPVLHHITSSDIKHTDKFDLSPENGGFEAILTLKNQNMGYPPQQYDQYGRPIQMYGYNNMPYMPPQSNSPGYNQQFAPPTYGHQPSHSMSRTPSQPERPGSANPQQQPGSSTPQQQHAQPKAGSNTFVKAKSTAIQIKNAAGETVVFSGLKQPASPGPTSSAKTTTPPAAAATATPPPPATKTPAPTHSRTESPAAPKTAREIQDELKAKIRQATQASAAEKPADQATEEPKAAVPTETPDAKEEKSAEPLKEAEKPAAPTKPAESEEDEMERMIREMEEADAKREKEEEEHRKKREAEKAANKAKDEEDRKKNAADEDRKLREAEREMERLEEEKERKRAEAEAGGKTQSVAEALANQGGGDTAESKVDPVADKLADLQIGDKNGDQKSAAGAEKRGNKPAALNLAPLNTKPVEAPQPSAALQSLKSARFLQVMDQDLYPAGISSPNPALNSAVAKKGKTFKYDSTFLLQFQKVFTEQPSLEFHQQVKSLIGEDGQRTGSNNRASTPRQASRGGANVTPIGAFNAPPGRTIPTGTTSEQRFAASMSSGALPRGTINPMASFQRPGGAFPGGSMSRTSSQTNLVNSPRQSSRATNRGSRRGGADAKEAQAAKTMPLTAGLDIKPITTSSTGWKPSSLASKGGAANAAPAYMDPEMVQRKVKAALNKMTPEKFDRIADQILDIASQSKNESDGRTLRQVIQLTFEKATDESHWASMYAKFCKRMLETMSPEIRDERIKDTKNGNVVSGGALFRKYLLNRCQEEFERGWTTNLPEPKEAEEGEEKKEDGKALGETAMMSDEYYVAAAAKRRGLGLVQFIGELYKLGMLTERIMHECVRKLVDYKGVPDEAEIESLSKLLRTIGANLDATEKGRPMMDVYFIRIQSMVDMPELHSRMKFMLMDVIDLRRANWMSKENNKGPKTLDEVRAEAEAAQAAKAQEAAKANQRGGGRMPSGRGDARNFSAGYQQQSSNQVHLDDLRRLKGSTNRTSSASLTLGPSSMFASRSNSGRRVGPGGSLGRPGDDSGGSSRTGTPPVRDSNAFSLLANMESENPASPPSVSASPAIAKATPADSEKKEAE